MMDIIDIIEDEWTRTRNSTNYKIARSQGNATIFERHNYGKQYTHGSNHEGSFEDLIRSVICTTYVLTHLRKAYKVVSSIK